MQREASRPGPRRPGIRLLRRWRRRVDRPGADKSGLAAIVAIASTPRPSTAIRPVQPWARLTRLTAG